MCQCGGVKKKEMKLEVPERAKRCADVQGELSKRPAADRGCCVDLIVGLGLLFVVCILVCMAAHICQDEDELTVTSYRALLSEIATCEDAVRDVRSCYIEDCEDALKAATSSDVQSPPKTKSATSLIHVPSAGPIVSSLTRHVIGK